MALTDVAKLDAHMADNSYVEGYAASQKDMGIFQAISKPSTSHPHALRWYTHIASFSAAKMAALPGTPQKIAAPPTAPSTSKPVAEPKVDTPAKAEKKEKPKKEEKKKEEKPKEKVPDPAAEAAKAAAAREKFLAKIIKEGGKKGVEIEGASDMGGLDFFCTTMELPDGDTELLALSMEAMNAQPDPDAEDRKGCSGHVGKMIFSAGVGQLALVAYVPDNEHNKSAEKVGVQAWMDMVLKEVKGGEIVNPIAAAKSPHGGKVIVAKVAADPEKGKFPLKDKDTAMQAAFNFLRAAGAFPEDGSDDEDDMCFGDDAFESMGF